MGLAAAGAAYASRGNLAAAVKGGSAAAREYRGVTSLSWTQPVCDACWTARCPGLRPIRVLVDGDLGELETCCDCGAATQSGIYVRVDPRAVPHPTRTK